MEKVEAIAVIPAVLMAPMVIKRGLLKTEVKANLPKIVAVSVLTFAAYFLVLVAMKSGTASYVRR